MNGGFSQLLVSRWVHLGLAAWLTFVVTNAGADAFAPFPTIQSQNTPSVTTPPSTSNSASFDSITIPVSPTGVVVLGVAASVLAGLALIGLWYVFTHTIRREPPLAYLYRIDEDKVTPHFINSPTCRIGRHANNNICIKDRSISRFHAEVIRNGVGTFTLIDRGSRNGVRVGNRPVTSAVLRDGEFVEIGDVRLRFSQLPRDYMTFDDTEVVDTGVRNVVKRRVTPRQFMTIDVRLYNDQLGWVQGRIRDLSARGAFIETTQKDLIPRTPIDMLFPTITGVDRRWFRVPGEVVRENRTGVGIAFYELDGPAVNYIRTLSDTPANRMH
ncbi:MAG: FHA domain-containing protein [Gammaproteobacteria bacterium]|nr:FHA domain-containing protein [Gammaproteobacteria bacterium]MDH3466937.1 FHA domain-containing protein [Gammaproteobacteria bacterium]